MPLLLTCYPLPHPHMFLKLTLELKYHLPFLKFSNKEDDYGLSALYVLKKVPTKKTLLGSSGSSSTRKMSVLHCLYYSYYYLLLN